MQIQQSDSVEVEHIIRQCIGALRTWDRAKLAEIFADSPQSIHFGTSADECYIGGAAYLRAMERQRQVSIPDIEFDFLPGSPVIQMSGDVAWAVGNARIAGTTATHRYFHIDTRLTFILQKLDDRWQIVHSHYSVGVPGPS
jgi:ketosteroid isomerase-like protein